MWSMHESWPKSKRWERSDESSFCFVVDIWAPIFKIANCCRRMVIGHVWCIITRFMYRNISKLSFLMFYKMMLFIWSPFIYSHILSFTLSKIINFTPALILCFKKQIIIFRKALYQLMKVLITKILSRSKIILHIIKCSLYGRHIMFLLWPINKDTTKKTPRIEKTHFVIYFIKIHE